jgi:quercetin dioxygenase-like cupin family protein
MEVKDIVDIQHHFPTNGNQVYIRQMSAPAGYVIGTHKHQYEHYSILGKGSVVLEKNGAKEVIHAPAVLIVEAGVEHKITSITAFTWFCVHQTDEDDGSKIDEVLIRRE